MKSTETQTSPTKGTPKILKITKTSKRKAPKSPKSSEPSTSSSSSTTSTLYMSSYIEQTPENVKDFIKIAKLKENQKKLQKEFNGLVKHRQEQHRMFSMMITNLRSQQEIMTEQIESYNQQYVLYRDLSEQMNHIITMLSLRVREEMGEEYLLVDPRAYQRNGEE